VGDDGRVECAGAMLRCSGQKLAFGSDVAVSIRPHLIRLWVSPPEKMENIVRQPWCGRSFSARAATIGCGGDDTQLRVVAPTAENVPQGAPVWLYMPPDGCRLLSG